MHGIKRPLKQQDRHMDLNVTDYEIFGDMVSDSALQLIFKTLPLAEYHCVPKTDVHNCLKRLIISASSNYITEDICYL